MCERERERERANSYCWNLRGLRYSRAIFIFFSLSLSLSLYLSMRAIAWPEERSAALFLSRLLARSLSLSLAFSLSRFLSLFLSLSLALSPALSRSLSPTRQHAWQLAAVHDCREGASECSFARLAKQKPPPCSEDRGSSVEALLLIDIYIYPLYIHREREEKVRLGCTRGGPAPFFASDREAPR